MVAHEFAAVDHLEDARRHVQQRMAVRVASFEQENAGARVFSEPRRGDAPGRAAADNDMIESFRHWILLGASLFELGRIDGSIRHCERSEATQGPQYDRLVCWRRACSGPWV